MSKPHPDHGGPLVTLAVRMSRDERAKLDVIAAVTGDSVTELVRQAIQEWLTRARSNPELQRRADEARAEAERKKAAQDRAINALFGGDTPVTEPEPAAAPPPAATPDIEPTAPEPEAKSEAKSAGRRGRGGTT